MAIINATRNDSRLEYTTILTDDTTGTRVEIDTVADGSRVLTVNIYVVGGNDDNNIYSNAQKEAVHTALVSAVQAKIGAGI